MRCHCRSMIIAALFMVLTTHFELAALEEQSGEPKVRTSLLARKARSIGANGVGCTTKSPLIPSVLPCKTYRGTAPSLKKVAFDKIPDPFNPPILIKKQKKVREKPQITLEGIVQSVNGASAAILACGDNRETVCVGEKFCGYLLTSIDQDQVQITRGKQKKLLKLD